MERRSERALRVGAMFGVRDGARGWGARLRMAERAAALIDGMLGEGEAALIVGTSGAGKSTLGRALARRVGKLGVMVAGSTGSELPVAQEGHTDRAKPRSTARDERVVDLFESGLEGAMGYLARAGLAEAAVMVAPARELSEGQWARLAIALGMERCERRGC